MTKRATLIVALVLLPALLLFAGESGSNADALDRENLLQPEGLLQAITETPESFYLVDVRTPQEYISGHIPTAIQIDYREIGDNPPTEDKDALIVVYCRSGSRAGSAVDTLRSLGYTAVLNWGGIIDWPYDVVTGSDPE